MTPGVGVEVVSALAVAWLCAGIVALVWARESEEGTGETRDRKEDERR